MRTANEEHLYFNKCERDAAANAGRASLFQSGASGPAWLRWALAMKAFGAIALFAFCLFVGALFSTVVTVAAWHIQIEPRAFQCWDDVGIFDTYWEDIDEHRGAGDKISAGWTWDEIKTVREIYIGAFFAIWAASSLIPFRFIMTREAAIKTLHATAAAPGS